MRAPSVGLGGQHPEPRHPQTLIPQLPQPQDFFRVDAIVALVDASSFVRLLDERAGAADAATAAAEAGAAAAAAAEAGAAGGAAGPGAAGAAPAAAAAAAARSGGLEGAVVGAEPEDRRPLGDLLAEQVG